MTTIITKNRNWVAGLVALGIVACCARTSLSAADAPSASQSSDPVYSGATDIKGILIVPRREDANPAGVTGIRGVVIRGPSWLKNTEFQQLLRGYLGSTLSDAKLKQLQTDIIKYCREHGHLVVDVFLREQDVVDNTIQLAVIEAKLGKVTVNNEGHKWFSDSLILREMRTKPGDPIIESKLTDDLSWMNQNIYQSLGYFEGSFHDVTATFTQGGLGEADLKLNVKDRFPLRPFVGYENSGFTVVGEDRFFAGFNWANVFGLDHRLNYQFTADVSFDKFRSQAGSYVIPLPWRHELIFFGAYAHLNPDYSELNDPSLKYFNNEGDTYQLSARYSMPLFSINKYEQNLALGFDFKSTDTPLLFQAAGTNDFLQTNQIQVAQFLAEYSGRLKDKWGATTLSIQGVYSPGDMTDKNTDAAFNEFAPGTKANYWYARAELRRETLLPYRASWYLRAAGQYCGDKLIPTEQWGLGGWTTVRGYNERVVNGDSGWLVVNELRTPRIRTSNLTRKAGSQDWVQGLIFVDCGMASMHDPIEAGYQNSYTLLSVGAGVRFEMADNLRLRVDYGYQLLDDYKSQPSAQLEDQPNGRFHIGAELSF
jgi:hemolysin activation/secretion protein